MAERKCPQCDNPVVWAGNPHRPFCSERCRLVDLQGWLGERYAIAGEPVAPDASGEDASSAVAPARDSAAAPRARRGARS